MKNQMKFSTTNITNDTLCQKVHDCPHCRCVSPASRPQSPLYRPTSPNTPRTINNHIYFNRAHMNDRSSSSNRSFTPERRKLSRGSSPRVTITYKSPPSSKQFISSNQINSNREHSMLSSVFSFGAQEEPKRPNILARNKKNNIAKKQLRKEESRYHIISQYKSLEEDQELARTIVQELQLNYDYFSSQDMSDISADVSL